MEYGKLFLTKLTKENSHENGITDANKRRNQ